MKKKSKNSDDDYFYKNYLDSNEDKTEVNFYKIS